MIYQVEINYKKGPSYTGHIKAVSSEIAKHYVLEDARKMGFHEKVKKINVRKEQ